MPGFTIFHASELISYGKNSNLIFFNVAKHRKHFVTLQRYD